MQNRQHSEGNELLLISQNLKITLLRSARESERLTGSSKLKESGQIWKSAGKYSMSTFLYGVFFMIRNDSLVSKNLNLVHYFCQRYQNQGVPYKDLFSNGCLGLLQACRRFEEGKGHFGSYASHYVKMQVLKALQTDRLIPLPPSKSNHIHTVSKAVAKLEQRFQRVPSKEEVSEFTGLPEKWLDVLEVAPKINSMDIPSDPEKPPLSEVIASNQFPSDGGIASLIWEEIKPLISDTDFQILRKHFIEEKPLCEIAVEYNRSRKWAEDHFADALKKIRAKFAMAEKFSMKIQGVTHN